MVQTHFYRSLKVVNTMGNFNPKFKEDKIHPGIEGLAPSFEALPNEIIVNIFSYLNKKEKIEVSMVNKRWFQSINYQIEDLLIRIPTTVVIRVVEFLSGGSKIRKIFA